MRPGSLAGRCHWSGVSLPMGDHTWYTWHTTGSFSRKSSSHTGSWRKKSSHSMGDSWVGSPGPCMVFLGPFMGMVFMGFWPFMGMVFMGMVFMVVWPFMGLVFTGLVAAPVACFFMALLAIAFMVFMALVAGLGMAHSSGFGRISSGFPWALDGLHKI